MKVSPVIRFTLATALLAGTAPSLAGGEEGLTRPSGYRSWTHVKSMVILPGHALYDAFGGIHHVYVNDKGRAAIQSGAPYPDGSVLVFDLFESPPKDNAHVAGARKITAIMVKDSERFAATGGWGFQAFKPDTPEGVVKDATTECFSCHAAQREHDYVFSRYEE